jgi:hypothetical protein
LVGYHYFNHNQKLFEIGEESTLAALTWGWGGLSGCSHQKLLADLNDRLSVLPAVDVLDVANRWAKLNRAGIAGGSLV